MGIRFDHPGFLLLALMAIPTILLGLRSFGSFDQLRKWTILTVRVAVILLVSILLAGPKLLQQHNQLTVIGLLDVSGSIRRFAELPAIPELGKRTNLEYIKWWFKEVTKTRTPDDKFGLIVFDGRAVAVVPPTRSENSDPTIDMRILEGTNVEEAIQLGLAMFPAETLRRLVLVSDGNETAGSALNAAREAAGQTGAQLEEVPLQNHSGVPIDVAPISYHVESDVQIVRLETPPNARPRQMITVRVLIDSIRLTSGKLTLLREGSAIDLNGSEVGFQRQVILPAGRSIHLANVTLGDSPINRFEALFDADVPMDDVLPENNRGETFVATPGQGKVLLVRNSARVTNSALEKTLNTSQIPVDVVEPEAIPKDLLSLQTYDLVILQNVGAFEIESEIQTLLARYVNEFGGGMIMVGGDESFGAGGWNGTPIEDVLPVELDLPKELKLTHAALVLVLDKSGSMGDRVAGTRKTQQQIANAGVIAAIHSLQPDSQVGIVVFDSIAHVQVALKPNENPERTIKRVEGIMPGGGTNMAPALIEAHRMLRSVDVKNKYVVCLSDGQSEDGGRLAGIVERMAAEGIEVSTIAVGDSADHTKLAELASIGGGDFYPVVNPATLINVIVDSVQVVNKPLLKEVTFNPLLQPGSTVLSSGISSAPPLEGLVLTAHRNDPRVTTELVTPDGEPVLVHWQAGLGSVAAFTSDAHGEWSRNWVNWPGYGTFWTQLIRATARSPISHDFEMVSIIEDGLLRITLDATTSDSGYLDYLVVTGTVYSPDGTPVNVRLHQVGPGRYETTTPANKTGNYIIALTPRQGDEALAPLIGGINQPSGAEYRRYRSNTTLLKQIAEETGGRYLDIRTPSSIDVFARAGMPLSISLLPAWRTFLWWLIGLLLVDIASRRIAWDLNSIRFALTAAVSKVTPAHKKADEVKGTLATLRKLSETLDDEIEKNTEGFEKLTGDTKLRMPDSISQYAEQSGQSQKKTSVKSAIDILKGKKAPQKKKIAREKIPDTENPQEGSTETTSGLLAAKRRLRDQMDNKE